MKLFYNMKRHLIASSLLLAPLAMNAQNKVAIKHLNSFKVGGEGAAEIVTFDAFDKTAWVLNNENEETPKVYQIDLSNPLVPVKSDSISLIGYGAPNSIVEFDEYIAVALAADTKTNNGQVVIFSKSTKKSVRILKVGALPDMLKLTNDKSMILVANEGEPNDDYTIDPEGSISIITLTDDPANAYAETISFKSLNNTEYNTEASGYIKVASPEGTILAQDLEPEYIAVSEDDKKAFIACQENNAMIILDLETKEIMIKGLGYKDHSLEENGFDGSDKSDDIDIKAHPVRGLYQPDAIDAFTINGKTYVISANEGDARDYDGYSEETRLEKIDLDPTVFPNASELQEKEELGRLKITEALGDLDGDGDYDQIFSYGARSFTVWDENGNKVWDSGNEFEKYFEANYPDYFNSDFDDEEMIFERKNRSDDKGAEPEGTAVGRVGDKILAFIGLERMGGIMVYDVTNPEKPVFNDYINTSDFENGTGDIAPEGLHFVSAEDSPSGRALLLVGYEVSGTLGVFEVSPNWEKDDYIKVRRYDMPETPVIGEVGDITYREGGISGLHFIQGTENEFFMVTDRGPNAVADNHPKADGKKIKYFPFPNYAPKIFKVSATNEAGENTGELNIIDFAPINRPIIDDMMQKASGLPNPEGYGNTGEEAWSGEIENPSVENPDFWGVDTEGIVFGTDSTLWLCDEYGPSVWNIDADTYTAINKYHPFDESEPNSKDYGFEQFKNRRANRGFEGVAVTPNGKIYSIIQSPMYNPSSEAVVESRIHRILEMDPATGESAYYVYLHEAPVADIRNKDWKIGDLVAVNNTEFLVLEHAQRKATNFKNVFKIDISKAKKVEEDRMFDGKYLEELLDAEGLKPYGIEPVAKKLMFELMGTGWDASFDKPEGITIIDANTIAICNDNDYGIDAPEDDGVIIETGKKTALYVYDLPADMTLNFTPVIPKKDKDSKTGIDQTSEVLNIYPNPTSGMVKFSQPISGQIINLSGKIIMNIVEETKEINLSSLSDGIYLLKTSTGFTHKIVVQ
ncbi:choice-of-anchor I family protein [Aureibacter tunicatorum]|uniref:DNA-binding beta-propeller fold protein YncE n=1 Tax=Aureibacter tunicatorum TaxID=866807 RepID=A0AAE3XTZ7_9BACT|nr:choice-of-anchor I family protein [Aureibacter tunicatorum]MDR6242048.1 DNA-binding beta-propeller fold protein YncE [Aureibacter tunicatorum]BDD03623.1 hypothetical protein AUTU_11060 [Aureibacter tunicatorum]